MRLFCAWGVNFVTRGDCCLRTGLAGRGIFSLYILLFGVGTGVGRMTSALTCVVSL